MADTKENKLAKFKSEILEWAKNLDSDTIQKDRLALLAQKQEKNTEKMDKFLMNFDSTVFALSALEMTIEQKKSTKAPKIRDTDKYEIISSDKIQKAHAKTQKIPMPSEENESEQTTAKSPKKAKQKELNTRETKELPLKDEQKILQEREDALYKDIFRLLELGDVNGALISLERLMIIAPKSGRVQEFLKVNNVKIKELYEERFGTLERVPRPTNSENKIPFKYFSNSNLEKVLKKIDGHTSIIDIIENSKYTPIEVCSSVNQLIRMGYLELI